MFREKNLDLVRRRDLRGFQGEILGFEPVIIADSYARTGKAVLY